MGGETDSDDDYYFPSGGSDGDDCDAYELRLLVVVGALEFVLSTSFYS